ncbi:MAG: hypothetical protein GF331_25785 [Chitinivibrionales bacterium]|nr:hypothetical protein [Chitinivibrionales bacterium]
MHPVCRPLHADNTTSGLAINLTSQPDFSTQWAFVDIMRSSRGWISNRDGSPWGQGGELELDEGGWVRSLDPGQRVTHMWDNKHLPAGRYTLLYDGVGTFRSWQGTNVVEEPGRIQFDIAEGGSPLFDITSVQEGNHARNIRLIMPGFEDTYLEEPFHPLFLYSLKNYSVLRFMDWGSTNFNNVERWEQRQTADCYMWQSGLHEHYGLPWEWMIELSNKVDQDAWICIPHKADEQYIRNLAEMFKTGLNPNLRVYLEHSNEVWNFMFTQTHDCVVAGKDLGLATEDVKAMLRYHSERSVTIFEIFEEVFGGHQRLVRVLGGHVANPAWAREIITWKDAYQKSDAVAIAPYFGNGRTDANVDVMLDKAEQHMGEVMQLVTQHRVQCDEFGLDLIAYEGGQHLVDEALTDQIMEANRSERMGQLYLQYFDAWKAAGGGLFAVFASVGAWSKWGCWGLLEYQDQDTLEVPKYMAVQQWAVENPRWWEDKWDPTSAFSASSDKVAAPYRVLHRTTSIAGLPRMRTRYRVPVFDLRGRYSARAQANAGRQAPRCTVQ